MASAQSIFRKQLKRTKTTHWRYVQFTGEKRLKVWRPHTTIKRHIVLFFFWRLLGFWGGFLDKRSFGWRCFAFLFFKGVFYNGMKWRWIEKQKEQYDDEKDEMEIQVFAIREIEDGLKSSASTRQDKIL